MLTDNDYIDRCLELARQSARDGESAVGSVLVSQGQIIGEGTEKSRQLKDVTRHAEVVAILDALHKGKDVKGATLYTNMEPCALCSYVIRHHKIRRVVFSKKCGPLGGTAAPFPVLTTRVEGIWDSVPEVVFTGPAE